MSVIGSFDRTKHFSELDDPLLGGATGALTPAQRRDASMQNLLGLTAATAEELGQYLLMVEIEAAETAGSHWCVAPFAGTIVDAFSVAYAQHTVANTVITAEIANVAVTGFSITITAGGAAGDVDQSTAITGANAVTAGQAIEVITDGGATAAGRVLVTLVIQRT